MKIPLKLFRAVFTDRTILFPTILLVGFVLFLVAVELTKGQSVSLYRDIIADPVPAFGRSIEESTWELCPTVRDGQATDQTLSVLLNIERVRDQIVRLMSEEQMDRAEYKKTMERLYQVDRAVEALRAVVPAKSLYTKADIAKMQPQLLVLREASFALNYTLSEAHKKAMQDAMIAVGKSENVRLILELMVFLCGFALVIALWDSVRHYKANAERARSAERVNALFAAALESTRVGVLIRDMRASRRPVVFINRAFTDLTGYELVDIGDGSSEFLFGYNTDQVSIATYRRVINLYESKTLNLMLYRKNGEPFWSEWHLSPVLAADGSLTHYVSLFTDTTSMRKVQEELLEAKQMAEHGSAVKTNFLAMMSHEIRTPINGILGVLKLVAERPLDDEQKHLLSIAMTSSQALHGIINDILDFAKIEAGKVDIFPEVFNIHSLIEEIAGLGTSLVGTKPVIIETDVADNLPQWVRGDEGRVRQILLNLVSNAIKFTDSGSVSLRAVPMMEQDVDGKQGVLARFEVQDTGIGISAEDIPLLFKEFSQVDRTFTRRFGGSGLGLAICRRLVLMMNGELGVESQPTKGSKFWFMIPLEVAAENDIPRTEPDLDFEATDGALSETVGKKTLLLVEDNDVNRMVAGHYLQKMGFAYDEATNGLEAIEKAKAKDYDLILMDVSMPEMDGMIATCHIRSMSGQKARVPIIALTAHAMAGDRELCLAAGMSDYLSKPVDFTSLVRILERWLRVRIRIKDDRPQRVEALPPASCDLDVRPDFDPSYLGRMREELGDTTVGKVTAAFLENAQLRVADLRAADPKKVSEAAHFLKSSAANCGLMKLSYVLARIEQSFAAQTPERRNELVAEVLVAFDAAIQKLRAYCDMGES